MLASKNIENPKVEWFSEWFDTPFYHILYENRDHSEAKVFVDYLEATFAIPKSGHILDLACGKGRFAKYLNQRGYKVTGIDLSEQSITAAQAFSNNRLRFEAGDMRTLQQNQTYDCILNMFTSFGYFHTELENQRAFASIAAALKKDGLLILDFFNTQKVLSTLPQKSTVTAKGIEFKTKKYLEDGFIFKDISFVSEGQPYFFQEKVMAITQEMFEKYFKENELKLIKLAGNYKIGDFDQQSERMIYIAKKA